MYTKVLPDGRVVTVSAMTYGKGRIYVATNGETLDVIGTY
jgi:hypothetical protein